MVWFVVAFFSAVLVAGLIWVAVWLFKARCPVCGKFSAGRVTGSSKLATVTGVTTERDPHTGEMREVAYRQTGYLITRACRFCGHRWDRIETKSRKVQDLTPMELDEIRRRELNGTGFE